MNGSKTMNDKINFISLSITDTQSTIRAVDTKIGILIVFICIPLTNISKVFSSIDKVLTDHSTWYIYTLIALFSISWIFSIIISIRAISAIDNPSKHIINNSECKGAFYAGYLYSPGLLDTLFNRDILKANIDLVSHYNLIPDNADRIATELTFEQMKLIYIREIKFNRLKWSLRLTFSWLTSGFILFLLYHYI